MSKLLFIKSLIQIKSQLEICEILPPQLCCACQLVRMLHQVPAEQQSRQVILAWHQLTWRTKLDEQNPSREF